MERWFYLAKTGTLRSASSFIGISISDRSTLLRIRKEWLTEYVGKTGFRGYTNFESPYWVYDPGLFCATFALPSADGVVTGVWVPTLIRNWEKEYVEKQNVTVIGRVRPQLCFEHFPQYAWQIPFHDDYDRDTIRALYAA